MILRDFAAMPRQSGGPAKRRDLELEAVDQHLLDLAAQRLVVAQHCPA